MEKIMAKTDNVRTISPNVGARFIAPLFTTLLFVAFRFVAFLFNAPGVLGAMNCAPTGVICRIPWMWFGELARTKSEQARPEEDKEGGFHPT